MPNSNQMTTYAKMDEIDLFDLFEGLWQRKLLIASITGMAVMVAGIYALLAPTTYMAELQARPPVMSDLAQINETGIFTITPEQAFQKGLNELESQYTKIVTFQALSDELEALERDSELDWRKFAESVSISLPTPAKGSIKTKDYATISYSDVDPAFSAISVNKLVDVANNLAAETMVEELKLSLMTRVRLLEDKIKQMIDVEALATLDEIKQLEEKDRVTRLELEDTISALRAKNLRLRGDRIDALEEALSVAESLDITEPVTLAQLGNRNQGAQTSLAIQANIAGEADPLYLRGSRMLKAEIAALKRRKSDDFTNPEIRDLEQELAQLERNRRVEQLKSRKDSSAFVEGIGTMRADLSRLRNYLEQDYSSIRMLKVDQEALAPEEPSKPDRLLIILLAGLAGGFFGILAALISYAAASRRVALSP